MELVHYFRIVRRRWAIVALFLVAGIVLGFGSSLLNRPEGPGQTFYLAKHTLLTTDSGSNLIQNAVLCTEGDVPKRAAAKLGFDNPQALAAKVTCEAHPETNLLYVAAADTDGKRAVLVADTFAEQLVVYLRDVADKQKTAKNDEFEKRIADLETEYGALKEQLAKSTDPVQVDLGESRLSDLANQINNQRDQQSNARSKPTVTQSLTTLSTAEAIVISKTAFEQLIASDPNKKTGTGSATATAARQSAVDAAISQGTGFGTKARAGLGGAAGLVIGIGLVIMLDRVDPRIRTKAEAEEAFGWPVIGEIPPLSRRERQSMALLAADEPRSRAAEAYRVLRSALLFANTTVLADDDHPIFANVTVAAEPRSASEDGSAAGLRDEGPDGADPAGATTTDQAPTRGQVIMVTSPGPSEGKTTTTANMAAILAETGRSVIVINCDFRRARVHLYLGAEDGGRQVIDTKVPGVKLVTQVLDNPNEANPAEVVAVQRQVIRNAREMFDLVLLDTAPLLTTNDATEVLSVADQIVIVAKAGKTHKEAADRAAELLERRGGPVVGVVLVGATDVPTSRYYYYGDSPDRAEPEPGEEETTPLAALLGDDGAPVETGVDAGVAAAANEAAPDRAADADASVSVGATASAGPASATTSSPIDTAASDGPVYGPALGDLIGESGPDADPGAHHGP